MAALLDSILNPKTLMKVIGELPPLPPPDPFDVKKLNLIQELIKAAEAHGRAQARQLAFGKNKHSRAAMTKARRRRQEAIQALQSFIDNEARRYPYPSIDFNLGFEFQIERLGPDQHGPGFSFVGV